MITIENLSIVNEIFCLIPRINTLCVKITISKYSNRWGNLGDNNMEFADQIKALAKRVQKMKESILTEEATKTSVIMPFFQALNYDIFNPEEFLPEFTADVGIKKGEKVDYAILQNKKPIILIEAKSIQEQLTKHDSQLFRYYGIINLPN